MGTTTLFSKGTSHASKTLDWEPIFRLPSVFSKQETARGLYKIPSKLYETPISQESLPSRIFTALGPFFEDNCVWKQPPSEMIMLFDPKRDERLARLEEELRCVDAVTSGLMWDVIAITCVRFGALGAGTKVKIKWLIETGAWTDATIALLQLELLQWKLRRLVNDDGKWLCSFSKQPRIPLEFDAVAEASHESLPLQF